ncbi:ECF transporter S component [Defluviitalea phaphyphila]|uniref:ECF transporter S component n=1 Tax=Defluviitalea phaphyphila TaxID=1473580 RepID=UPI0007310E55|nr:ECF transporter S component [Defluviitalea phaphyphila]
MQTTLKQKKGVFTTINLVKMGLLSALAFILMLLDFPVPGFLPFLQMDLSDIPAVIGTLSIGPAAGVIIQLLKVILHTVSGSSTGGIGPLANFIVGASYVYPLGLIYKYKTNLKGFIIGCFAGTASMAIIAALVNYFIIIPFYAMLFGMSIDTIVGMGTKINSNINSLETLILYSIVPFNLFKASCISITSYIVYKALKPLFYKK